MLVQALQQIQDQYGYLPRSELEFLAGRAAVPLYRVQEVASFFPHFRLAPPPPVTVHVCQSMACHLRGAAELLADTREALAKPIAEQRLAVEGCSCLGRCDRAPAVLLERHDPAGHSHDSFHGGLNKSEDLAALIGAALDGKPLPADPPADPHPPWQIDIYDRRHGGEPPLPYAAVRRLLAGADPKFVVEALKVAGLVGMGGAAARTWKKWQDVKDADGDVKYIVANGDESEPGTFKDRELLLHTPHLLIEGMLLAGLTLPAKRGYIFIRHEYPEQIAAVRRALAAAEREVPEALRRCPLEVFVSAGAYICGEESALLEAMEGRRAQPRNAPPEIRTNGLFDCPTVVNNIETFAWVPAVVLRRQGKWYEQTGYRFFSVSGDVRRPGVYEVPVSTTLGQLIDQHAGGLREGLELRAVATSGPSGGFLPPRLDAAAMRKTLDRSLPGLVKRDPAVGARVQRFRDRALAGTAPELDPRALELDVALFRALGLALGAGIVVYGGRPGAPGAMLDHARNCLEFFAKESCGKCVPCRLGCQQLVQLAAGLQSAPGGLARAGQTAQELARVMEVTSICGLGRTAAKPLLTFLDYFRDELTGPGPEARP